MLISGFGILALRLLLMCLNHGTHIRTTIAPLRISLRIPHHTTHCLYPLPIRPGSLLLKNQNDAPRVAVFVVTFWHYPATTDVLNKRFISQPVAIADIKLAEPLTILRTDRVKAGVKENRFVLLGCRHASGVCKRHFHLPIDLNHCRKRRLNLSYVLSANHSH